MNKNLLETSALSIELDNQVNSILYKYRTSSSELDSTIKESILNDCNQACKNLYPNSKLIFYDVQKAKSLDDRAADWQLAVFYKLENDVCLEDESDLIPYDYNNEQHKQEVSKKFELASKYKQLNEK